MAARDNDQPNGERRFLGKLERRNATMLGNLGDDEDQRALGGYAATFNNPATIGDYFIETIREGAFDYAIQSGQDVRALFNHDPNFVIGRTASKTLVLSEDAAGLLWEAAPPATSWAADLVASVDRGDISGCSFQFRCVEDAWDYSGDLPVRTLIRVDLIDVSAVTFPAYDDTTVALRSMAAAGVIPPLSAADQARLSRKRSMLDRLAPDAA